MINALLNTLPSDQTSDMHFIFSCPATKEKIEVIVKYATLLEESVTNDSARHSKWELSFECASLAVK